MPSGGTWKAQNKVRPGAYINFVSVPKPVGTVGERGVVAIALPMSWGATDSLIEVYGSDLLDGKSLEKIGCTAFDAESLPFRLALKYCYKGLFYRMDRGGAKATATLTNMTVSAKYAGTVGNKLSVAIIEDTPEVGKYTVNVLYDGATKESYVVETLGELGNTESVWVDFTIEEGNEATAPTATTGATLVGGTNGTVTESTFAPDFFNLITTAQWQCLAIQSDSPTLPGLILTKIKSLREDLGKKVQAVVYNNNTADYEGIISVKQGYKTTTDTVSETLFPIVVASMTAGATVAESNTAKVIEDAVEIINPIEETEVADNLKAGWFVLTYRQDGVVCVEQDINTLHTFTVDKNQAFSKNRVIRTLDEIGNTTALIFNRNYCGKVNNDAFGRNVYKSEIISLIDTLVSMGAVQNFDGATDVTVMQGVNIDSVVVDLTIQPVDSMEKLYLTVNVDA